MFAGIVKIHMHLPCVGIGELTKLEVNDDQTTQPTVKEEQIDSELLLPNPQPVLVTYESKVAAQLQKEALNVPNKGFFQIVLGILVFEIQKFKHKRVFQFFFGGYRIFQTGAATLKGEFSGQCLENFKRECFRRESLL